MPVIAPSSDSVRPSGSELPCASAHVKVEGVPVAVRLTLMSPFLTENSVDVICGACCSITVTDRPAGLETTTSVCSLPLMPSATSL